MVVFDGQMFLFFDRENFLPPESEKDPQVIWNRWKREVIDRQTRTAHGAERYIRMGRAIFLDAKKTNTMPMPFDAAAVTVHKIIIAHGAKKACEMASPANIYGSLAIRYCESDGGETAPFHVEIDKRKPVHVFDSHNLPIVLTELDTVKDFSDYLDEKVRAVAEFDWLSYCGEEDLLAHCLWNYDQTTGRHVVGPTKTGAVGVHIGEGEWLDFSKSIVYRNTKRANEVSYFWDELIQRTCQNGLDGTLGGDSGLLRGGPSAITEMVKEPRFVRRTICERIKQSILNFPDGPGELMRSVSLIPSYRPGIAYVFLQVRASDRFRDAPEYREIRRAMLELACGAARNKWDHLKKIVGIAIDAAKFAGDTNSEDFVLMDCANWSDEQRDHYATANREIQFFGTPAMKQHREKATEFVQPARPVRRNSEVKVGRNDQCPCGSGKKYKKCHGT
jgi:hypothetical protein